MAATGLLAKAEHYLGSATPLAENSFYAWAARFHVCHACILRTIDERFIPVHAIGLDAQSLVQACAERPYWEEIIKQTDDWQSFQTDDELSPFFQFFSGNYRQFLSALHILRTKDALLLVIVLEQETLPLPAAETAQSFLASNSVAPQLDSSPEDYTAIIDTGIKHAPAQLLLLSLKLAVEESISDLPYAAKNIEQALKDAIYTELYAQCKTLFQNPNTTHSGDGEELKIVLFSPNEPDELLLRFHISQSFIPILGNAAQKVILLQAGTSLTVRGALSFLEQG